MCDSEIPDWDKCKLDFSARVDVWKQSLPPAIREIVEHQFTSESKYFRPKTVYACALATGQIESWGGSKAKDKDVILDRALVVELIHNVTLIMDDVVDRSPERRGHLVPHSRCSPLTAFMVSGYLIADAYKILAARWVELGGQGCEQSDNPFLSNHRWDLAEGAKDKGEVEEKFFERTSLEERWRESEKARGSSMFDHLLITELLQRLAVVECLQWEFRQDGALIKARQASSPSLGLADWYFLAREDTGSMFEICACIGGHSQHLRRFGRLVGVLYHGSDDVCDLQEARDDYGKSSGSTSLGGTGQEDIEDRILTLPVALALQGAKKERFKQLFRNIDADHELDESFKSICSDAEDVKVLKASYRILTTDGRRKFLEALQCSEAQDGGVKEILELLVEQMPSAKDHLEKIRSQAEDEIDFLLKTERAVNPGPLECLLDSVNRLVPKT